MRIAFTLSVILVASAECLSQHCEKLSGKIYDSESGTTLPGAGVRSLINITSGTIANANGEFEISAIENDSLQISFIGFNTKIVHIGKLGSCSAEIFLEPVAQKIDEIEISAEKIIAEEFTIRKIKKLEIYSNPSAKADPILAANSLPSATTTDESANISLRGGSPAETGIFLNNVPINDAVRYSQMNGIGTFSIFNTALVNNVQVFAGNPPLEYGNSTSGIIALQTDESIPTRSVNTLSLTLASHGFYTNRKLNANSSLTIFSNYQPSLLLTSLNRKALKDLKKFTSNDLGVHYFLKAGKKMNIKIFNYSLRETYEFRYDVPTYSGTFDQNKLRNFTVANVRRRIRNIELSYNQGFSFSRAKYKYGTTDIDLKLNDLYSSINIQKIATSFEWKAGVSYDYKGSDFNGSFPTFDFASGLDHPVSSASSRDYVRNPEIYFYSKKYLGKWIVAAGARKNIAIENLRDYTSAQGNLHYKPNDGLSLNFSAGKYNKYQLPQGESVEPQLLRSTQYSADLNHQRNRWENSMSIFYKQSTVNSTKTIIRGVELFTRHKFNSNLRFQLSLTSLDAHRIREQSSEPSPYNIHYFVRGNIEYKIRGTWTITTVFLFRQGSYYNPVVSASYVNWLNAFEPTYSQTPERLPSYNTIDLSTSKIFPLTEKITCIAFVSTGNIANFKNVRAYTYNFDYSEKSAYQFSQRTLYFGIILNF
jgi:hypothetical protein